MTLKSTVLSFLGLAISIFLVTSTGYYVWGFLHGNIPEPINWIRRSEEAYNVLLVILGLVGAVFFGLKLFRGQV